MSSKNACTPIFIAALFTVAKIWKQPECPSTDEWIKEYVIYIYLQGMPLSYKNKMLPFAAAWTDLKYIILSEICQRKTNTVSYRLHVKSKIYNTLVNKTKKNQT